MATLFKKKYMHVPSLSLGSSIGEIGKNPFVDWIFVLVITLIVALCLIAGGAHLYWQVTIGGIQSSIETSSTSSQKFDQKSLSAAIGRIDAQETTIEQAKRGYSGAPDPSL